MNTASVVECSSVTCQVLHFLCSPASRWTLSVCCHRVVERVHFLSAEALLSSMSWFWINFIATENDFWRNWNESFCIYIQRVKPKHWCLKNLIQPGRMIRKLFHWISVFLAAFRESHFASCLNSGNVQSSLNPEKPPSSSWWLENFSSSLLLVPLLLLFCRKCVPVTDVCCSRWSRFIYSQLV